MRENTGLAEMSGNYYGQ